MATVISTQATVPVSTVTAGFAGFICEVTNAPVAIPDCLACAQEGAPGCPMTPALIERIAAGIRPLHFSQDHAAVNSAQFGISVTELLGCPRRFRLVREHPYYEKPTALANAQRGTARHADLALYSGPGLKELRLSWHFTYTHPDGTKVRIIMTGQPDLLSLRDGGWVITDYKDTQNPPRSTYTYTCHIHPDQVVGRPHWRGRGPFICPDCGILTRSQVDECIQPPTARDTHAMQIHLLALLVQKNATLLAKAYNTDRQRHSTWNTPPATPDTPVTGGEIAYLGMLRCPVVPDVAAAMTHLKHRLAALLPTQMHPILSDQGEQWECGYCPVKDACEQLHGGPVGRDQVDSEG
jgi:hypothetical protein